MISATVIMPCAVGFHLRRQEADRGVADGPGRLRSASAAAVAARCVRRRGQRRRGRRAAAAVAGRRGRSRAAGSGGAAGLASGGFGRPDSAAVGGCTVMFGVGSAFLGTTTGSLPGTAAVVQVHRLLIAHRDAAQILRGEFGPAHDVRDQRDHQFLALAVDALAGEQAAENRNAGQPGDAGPGLGVLLLGQAAEQLHLAFVHADVVRDLALPDDRLIDAAQVDVAGDAGNVQVDVQRDVAVIVHARRAFPR